MVEDGAPPTFGLWYDFRQRLPLTDYAAFYAECLEEIEEGERLGYEGVWLSEHHFVDDGYLPSPLVVAATIAARTSRMTIGTNVLLLPMHHPLRVAEDAAVADLVSGGRFVLGVGQGYVQHEFETLGFERRYRPSLFEEGIEAIRHAWRDGRIGYEGKRWRFDDLPFEPRPQQPPPIYVGAFADPAIDRAARLADGFLASAGGGAFGNTYRKVRDALARHGREDDGLPLRGLRGGLRARGQGAGARDRRPGPRVPAHALRGVGHRSREACPGTRPRGGPALGALPRRIPRGGGGGPDTPVPGGAITTTSASGVVCRA